jgi:endonuclease-3
MTVKERALAVDKALKKIYPEAKISLDFTNPLELLVATILSAQCTDERVNKVTASLFKKYKTAKDYANATPEELEEDIHSTGFYKNKAKAIRNCCAALVERHGGDVPSTMEELTALSGVGRKTANVILGNVYGIPGVVVDTHVGRVSRRVGLTKEDDPEKVERDLMAVAPKKDWVSLSHRVIQFGRQTCKAAKPACGACPIYEMCKWEGKGAPRPLR